MKAKRGGLGRDGEWIVNLEQEEWRFASVVYGIFQELDAPKLFLEVVSEMIGLLERTDPDVIRRVIRKAPVSQTLIALAARCPTKEAERLQALHDRVFTH